MLDIWRLEITHLILIINNDMLFFYISYNALLDEKKSPPLILRLTVTKTEHIEKIALAIFTLFCFSSSNYLP